MMNFKYLLKVTLGIGLIIIGLLLLFQNAFLGGILFVIGGIFLLPQTLKIIEKKLGKPFGRTSKYLIIIVSIIFGISLTNHSSRSNEQEKKLREQEAFNQLPQHIKDSLNLVAKEQKDRQEKLERQFSPWDGSHIGLTRFY